MEKSDYFKELHQELAERYNIPIFYISFIRHYYLGEKKNRKEIARLIIERYKLPRSKRNKKSRESLKDFFKFVVHCPTEEWDNITQLTKYDNAGGI